MELERKFNLLRKKNLGKERLESFRTSSYAESLVGLPWELEWDISRPIEQVPPAGPVSVNRQNIQDRVPRNVEKIAHAKRPEAIISKRPCSNLGLLKDLSQCKKCFPEGGNLPLQEYSNPVSPNHRALNNKDNSPIDVLFLVDFPKEKNKNSLNQIFMGERALFFERIVQALKLEDGKYCWSTLLKCNPVDKEDYDQMGSNCYPWLVEEILSLRPKLILTFGALPTRFLSEKKERLAKIHGKFFDKTIEGSDGLSHSFQFLPLFHVDYILMNPSMKKTTWVDLQKVIERLSQD